MKYLKELVIIFGITMAGELLNRLIPLPVPAGVYGLFLLLALLCSGVLKLSQVENSVDVLRVLTRVMLISAAVGLLERMEELRAILVPFLVITFLSTLIVMTVTGKTTEFILHFQRREDR